MPNASHAETADTAQSALDAETALNAVNAIDAKTINGFGAGCETSTVFFAGDCWEASPSQFPVTAPVAAAKCAARGGTLPDALSLAAFATEPGINLNSGGEWSRTIPEVSGSNVYAVAIVAPNSVIDKALSIETHFYRCVIPLLS